MIGNDRQRNYDTVTRNGIVSIRRYLLDLVGRDLNRFLIAIYAEGHRAMIVEENHA